jgi:hypothetical protein
MPGLVRGVARTAVVAGTATAVSNRVSRRQANKWAQQGQDQQGQEERAYQEEPAAPPMPAAPSSADTLAQLKELGELKASGVLTEPSSRYRRPRSSAADRPDLERRVGSGSAQPAQTPSTAASRPEPIAWVNAA